MTADTRPSRNILTKTADRLRGFVSLPPIGTRRYFLEMGFDIDRLVHTIAEEKQIPSGEVIRRAVAVYAYFDTELKMTPGLKISQTDMQDRVLKDIQLP